LNWLDVSGPPGSGKSTICYPIWGDRSVTWDGLPPPSAWKPFVDELNTLVRLVSDHPSAHLVAPMNDRSLKKMATVSRMAAPPDKPVFIQTGFIQRITGFGWRLQDMNRDINLIRRALWLMPVSAGAVFLEADLETCLKRNRDRELNPATAHENRSYQVPLMMPSIAIAKEVMRERGVPVIEVDVQNQSADNARAELLSFAGRITQCHQGANCDV
jgi:broad-specificity NMP kinase